MCSAEADLGLPYLSSATFDVGTAVPSFADSYGGTWWHLGFSHYIHMLYYVISYIINYIYTDIILAFTGLTIGWSRSVPRIH